jgi:serine/threonine protein kinase/Tol biopolymer transport system component
MDAQRWQEVQVSFDALIELDAVERGNRLTALGSTDPELRAAVERLLAADARADSQLAPLEDVFVPQSAPTLDPLGVAGRTISHFEVYEQLGAGGMGVVYRAQDTRLGRPVALKFLLPPYNFDAAAKARFLREAHSAAALDHPNLCTIYDVGTSEDGLLFLAMALYAGETVKARLARDAPLPVHEALEITRQIVQGLTCAHAAGIVHRDLKPGNVMLLPDGTVKILDFGLAKARDQSISESGAMLGTVAYMAPEQIRGETVDGRADLWAVGLVLYELLTGRKPFAGEQDVAIAHSILHDEPAPPSTLRSDLSAAAEDLLLTLLRKDPATRYQSAKELVPDLAALATIEAASARSGSHRSFRRRRIVPVRRRRLLAAAAVLMVSAAGYTAVASPERGLFRVDSARPVSRYNIALPDTEALAGAGFWHHRIAISPNGEYVAYAGSSNVNHRLWLRRRDQLHATQLPGTEGAINPFFSPDGSRVGFVSTVEPRSLKVVSLRGGLPRTVIDSLVDFGGGAWGCNGYIYFDGHLEKGGITRIPETGGVLEGLTTHDRAAGEGWHFQPEPLPNCKGVLFVVWNGGDASEAEVAVLDLASGKHRPLVRGVSPRYAASGHLLYGRADGALMAAPFDQDKLTLVGEPVAMAEGVAAVLGVQDLAVSASGTLVYTTAPARVAPRELVWVTRDGKATPIDSTWRARFMAVALSPDGTKLAIGVQDAGNTDVWIKQLNGGSIRKLTSQSRFNDQPDWTPDGRSVLFLSRGRDNWDLYQMPADGSALPRLLLDEASYIHQAEYSRDGKWLLYEEDYQIFARRTDGDTTRAQLVVTDVSREPRLSPDGRWLAYFSSESGTGSNMGREEVFVRPFPNTGDARWQISTEGGFAPRWSPNGRELYYRNFRRELIAVTVRPGATFAVGERRVLFSTEGYMNALPAFDVAPDGSRFVMIRLISKAPDEFIWVDNFFEELKTKVKRGRD